LKHIKMRLIRLINTLKAAKSIAIKKPRALLLVFLD